VFPAVPGSGSEGLAWKDLRRAQGRIERVWVSLERAKTRPRRIGERFKDLSSTPEPLWTMRNEPTYTEAILP
jgi:hypothetical protein